MRLSSNGSAIQNKDLISYLIFFCTMNIAWCKVRLAPGQAVIEHPEFIQSIFDIAQKFRKTGIHVSVKRNTVRLLPEIFLFLQRFHGRVMNICFDYIASPGRNSRCQSFFINRVGASFQSISGNKTRIENCYRGSLGLWIGCIPLEAKKFWTSLNNCLIKYNNLRSFGKKYRLRLLVCQRLPKRFP